MVEKICRECGAIFTIARRRAEQGRGVYCSRQCAGLGKARNRREGKNAGPEKMVLDEAAALLGGEGGVWNKPGHGGIYENGRKAKTSRGTGNDAHNKHDKSVRKTARYRIQRQLQQSFSLELCPWQTGAVPPVCYDSDYHAGPDTGWGY